jgi:peptidoglycan hydrolase FlgJ
MDISNDPRAITTATNIKNDSTDPKEQKLRSLRKSCREFEAIYINEVYKTMRKTVPDSGLFKKDMASGLYHEMLDMEMAKQTAEGDGIGLGKSMYEQLVKHHFPNKK